MIIAIMQPYFFPYIGYFQLMRAVDLFIFYDDVQYINRGWVNRNRILVDNKIKWLTLPVLHADRTLPINHRHYVLNDGAVETVKEKVRSAYLKAPAYKEAYALVDKSLQGQHSKVSDFNMEIFKIICTELGIQCAFEKSSNIDIDHTLRGENKILDICSHFHAERYINAVGGISLYSGKNFAARHIQLSFLKTEAPPTPPSIGPELLSIIHELMCFGQVGVKKRLDQYRLEDVIS